MPCQAVLVTGAGKVQSCVILLRHWQGAAGQGGAGGGEAGGGEEGEEEKGQGKEHREHLLL